MFEHLREKKQPKPTEYVSKVVMFDDQPFKLMIKPITSVENGSSLIEYASNEDVMMYVDVLKDPKLFKTADIIKAKDKGREPFAELIAKNCIVSMHNIFDKDGNEVGYTPEVAKEFLLAIPFEEFENIVVSVHISGSDEQDKKFNISKKK